MLVLSRQTGESIMIDNDVKITIVAVMGDKVRIGIDAPKHLRVDRREVYDDIKRNGLRAKPSLTMTKNGNVRSNDLKGNR